MRSASLRKRLILGATLVLVTALGLVGLALQSANHRGAVSALQARMESYVYLVLAAMEVEADGSLAIDDEFADPRLLQPGSGVYLAVSGADAGWRSRSALGTAFDAAADVRTGESVFGEPLANEPYYSLDYGVGWQLDDGRIEPYTVSVRIDRAELEQQTSAFRLGLWRWLGAAAAILVLAQAAILALGFRPLGRVARDVARVESGQSERLAGPYPRELEPLVRNVNRLLDTEKSNQERIRNALDSLAHSLKTPLAVIRAGLPADGSEAAVPLRQAVDDMQHLIATRLERAGATARRSLAEPVPVAQQLQRILDSLQKVHARRAITAESNIEDGLAFYGEQRDLLELLGNLLDNAFKYGRSRVLVTGGAVDGERARPGLWLRIEDDGPGIAAEASSRLLQRGTRGDERAEGHGLGLAIVTELVSAYGGSLDIGRSELGGARFDIRLPAL